MREALTFLRRLLQERPERWRSDIRRVVASALVAVGVLLALFAGVFRYVDQHFYDADRFLETNAQLADNADMRQFLFDGFRDEIIELAEGEPEEEDLSSELDDLLAGDAEDAAPDPVTEAKIARDEAIEDILGVVFDSDLYDDMFDAELARTQLELVRSAELESRDLLRDRGEIFFNMRALYNPINELLGADELTAEITTQVVPDDYGIFKVADRDTTVDPLWVVMASAPGWRGLATVLAILSFIGAVVIAERRPSAAIQFGGGLVGVAAVTVVLIFLIRFMVPLLTRGGASSKAAVAIYSTNLFPLITIMIRLAIMGAVLAAIGGIARLIWPDDWVYSSVSDERGVRSVMSRRGRGKKGEAEQQQQPVPAAAAAPVAYPGYPQQPYPGYPQQWGQPYPGQYPPGYQAPYPVGPYAQPQQPQGPSQHYTSPGKPTVPVMPVSIPADDDLVPPAAPPLDPVSDDLPADAAQAVPRVVATTDTTLDQNATSSTSSTSQARKTVVESGSNASTGAAAADSDDDLDSSAHDTDEWATEQDW